MIYEKNAFTEIMQKDSRTVRKQWILHRYNTRTRRIDHEHNGYTGRPHAGENGPFGEPEDEKRLRGR
jgi:4-hydroxy-L-threonine phosphate dehydrogenase PdxA